jgi:hypothetical protein
MFRHIRVEDRLECQMLLELEDLQNDISDQEKEELYMSGKRHYIYTHFYYYYNDNRCDKYIFAFTSQQELLDFIIDITDEIYQNGNYQSECDLFYYFLRIQESKYPEVMYKEYDNCSECDKFYM